MGLERYRTKRHFGNTPEPSGAEPVATASQDGLLYVIQKHAARRLHYDFRLELDGVLLSWAVPKGPSLDPADRHLAVRVEDHPLAYGSFEGTIPAGEYGAGAVELWDRGTWEPEGDAHEGLSRGDLKFTLHGRKLQGSWALVRLKPRPGEEDKENWLLIKHRDEHSVTGDGQAVLRDEAESVASGRTLEEIAAEPAGSVWHSDRPADRQTEVRAGEEYRLHPSRVPGARKGPMPPRSVTPQLATLVERAPEGPQWLHEVKFDGYRALTRIEDGSAVMYSRNGADWSGRYQVLVDQAAALPVESAVLDGEVVVQLPDGTTSFQELQGAIRARGGDGAGRLLYYVFDLLYLDGYDLLETPVEDRKALLQRLLSRNVSTDRLLYSDHVAGEGGEVLRQACRLGLEGVISKRAGTGYRPGARGPDWLKSKCRHEQEFVVGGFTDPSGTRVGFGALLLGVHEDGSLRYVGKVGSGFSEKALLHLGRRLREMETQQPPFSSGLTGLPAGAHWVEPVLVAEVAFSEWTRNGHVRHPSFKGLREDMSAGQVRREREVDAAGQEVRPALGEPAGGRLQRQPGGSAGPQPHPQPPPAGIELQQTEVRLTHPDRVFWPGPGVTKRGLADYYQSVADWMLPYVVDRPLSMVRCPDGVDAGAPAAGRGRTSAAGCFFYKHPGPDSPGEFRRMPIQESAGVDTYIAVTGPAGLVALAQMGVLEIHVWGSTWPDIEHPDVLVFDLDPDPAVGWSGLTAGARLMRDTLWALGLESFVKTTGGKGLHVVVPVLPSAGWDEVHSFCRAVAQLVVDQAPDRYTATMAKAKRTGKIYIDYVRNTRGATSIAPFSTRAKGDATVAVPVRWSELSGRVRPDSYTVGSLQNRLRRLRGDPWEGYFEAGRAQSVAQAMRRAEASAR